MEAAVSPLSQWESFYVIVGSSAGALTGLQFVVIALVADMEAATSMLEIRAFGSPTVVHFCASLLIAAIMSAPWHALSSAGYGLGACGAIGVAYAISVVRHARRQTGYHPDMEDWAWYIVLPLLGYVALLTSAATLHQHSSSSLFVIAGTSLLLVFIGIHNAWDAVTYIAVERGPAAKKRKGESRT